MKKKLLLLLLAAVLVWTGCEKEPVNDPTETAADLSGKVATDWFRLALRLTKETPGFTPPVAARAFGYSSLALYESVVPGMPEFISLQGQLTDFIGFGMPKPEFGNDYHWGLSANAALANIMRQLYRQASPENLAAIDSLEAAYVEAFSPGLDLTVLSRSINFGIAVGEAVFAYSVTDGQDEAYLNNFPADFTFPTGTGFWIPTPPDYQAIPLQPYWGEVRTFVPNNAILTQPIPPPAFSTDSTSLFFTQALEVYALTTNSTPEQTTIAEFWSDDPGLTATPPGHSIAILTQILEDDAHNLAKTAHGYAMMGIAVHDAFVSCWRCKYAFSLLRPVTYINQYMDPNWAPLLNTPPFPEYTSGHSVQAGAASMVLIYLFGFDYSFTDRTHADRTDIDGTPRFFNNFSEMANEAALSRLYGGIHYRAAMGVGITQGQEIGKNVVDLKFQ